MRKDLGFTLLEVMAYMSVLVILLSTSYFIFVATQNNSNALLSNSRDIIRTLEAGEQWRQDIREGIEILPQQDILQIIQKNRRISYQLQEDIVMRQIDDEGWQPVLTGVVKSKMLAQSRTNVVAWCWEVELKSRKQARVLPLFTFYAVGGGE